MKRIIASPYKAHPWHGVDPGAEAPAKLTAFVEIVPTDTVKYEIDKASGYLKVDRPQKYSNICPAPYGFVPRTYCGDAVAALCMQRTGRTGIQGDGDPLDICILTEKTLPHSNILLRAVPIGGFRMLDANQADDKILAVLEGDAVYGDWQDIGDCAPAVIDRLHHYFLTYKAAPSEFSNAGAHPRVEIAAIYGRDEAHAVIRSSFDDYARQFLAG